MTPKPCECPTPAQGIMCKRRCLNINPERWWELCSQNCPPERPCDKDDSLTVRKYCDGGLIKLEKVTPEERKESLWQKFLLAMKDEIAWRAAGGRGPTPEEKADRRSKCDGCKKHHDESSDSCKLCGCYLEAGLLPPRLMGKLDCATQRCPIGLWETVGGAVARGCGGKNAANTSGTPIPRSGSNQLPDSQGATPPNPPSTSG